MKRGGSSIDTYRNARSMILRATFLLGILALAIGIGAVGPPLAGAESFAVGSTVAVNTDSLNLRAAPSTDADVLLVLSQGHVMKVTDGPVAADGYTWYQVDVWVHGPTSGWVAGEYLLAMSNAPGEDVPGGFPEFATVQVVTDLLNVRTGPGLDYSVIRQIAEGAVIMLGRGPIEADGYSWYTIDIADQPTAGWVAGEYLALVPDDGSDSGGGALAVGDMAIVDAAALNCRTGPGLDYSVDHVMVAGETVTVLDGPIAADGYHWYKLEMTNGDVAWAIGEGLTGTSSDGGGTGEVITKGSEVIVATDLLNLRSGAGLSKTIIDTLPSGTKLVVSNGPIAADGYDWYEVETADGELGWVAGIYLAPAGTDTDTGTGGFAIGDMAVVDTAALNCRAGPGLKYSVDHVMKGGEQVTVLDGPIAADGYHWYKLQMANGDTAWAIGEGLV